jgi:AcrR family transcriptional regulator
MADERVDRRVRRTRELLRSALLSLILEKGYERVTVRDIIDRADVGRSTFYAHFTGKDDLFLAGFDEVRRLFEPPGSLAGTTTAGETRLWPSARVFEHFWEYRTVWKAMAGKQGGNLVRRRLHELLCEVVREQLRPLAPRGEPHTRVPLEVLVQFTADALLGLGLWWLDEDLPYSPAQMDEFFRRLSEPGIRAGLRPRPQPRARWVIVRFIDLAPDDPRLLTDALPVLAELRPHLTPDLLTTIAAEGYRQGLRFTAAYDEHDRCVGVAGWRIVATTLAVRKLYVDDLVTSAGQRSHGVGRALLAELRRRARAAGCHLLDLDSGVTRHDAHRFYLRERMEITAFHFQQPLSWGLGVVLLQAHRQGAAD